MLRTSLNASPGQDRRRRPRPQRERPFL